MLRRFEAVILRAALVMAALATATPAMAQKTPAPHTLVDTSLEAILLVCTSAVRDKFDMNDEAALASHGLEPVDDASEADSRQKFPGIEMAVAEFPTATVMVGLTRDGVCRTLITGDGHVAVRDRLVSELTSHGYHSQREGTAARESQVFDFGAATISVTTKQGVNNVAVTVQLKE